MDPNTSGNEIRDYNSYPNFDNITAKSRQQLSYSDGGPSSRNGDRGHYVQNIVARYQLQTLHMPRAAPWASMIGLQDLCPSPGPLNKPSVWNDVVVNLHYRVLHPSALKLITGPNTFVVVDTSNARAATLPPAPPATVIPRSGAPFGDIELGFSMADSYQQLGDRVYHAIGYQTGLEGQLNADHSRPRWMWAMFAECALLSDLILEGNLRETMVNLNYGGWWLRVYLIEVHANRVNGADVWSTS